MHNSPNAGWKSVVVLVALWAGFVAHAPAATAKPQTAAGNAGVVKEKVKAVRVAPAAEADRFSLAPAPDWVQALQPSADQAVPAAALQVLLLDRQTRVEAGGTVRFQHVLRQVNESAGLQKAAQIELEFDPSYQRLVLHQLQIWRQGQRIDKLDRKLVKLLHREPQLERQIVDGRMTASIVLDDLRVGDRVEWAASFIGDNPVFAGKIVDQEWMSASSGPIGLAQWRVLIPKDRPVRHGSGAPGIEFSEREHDGWRELLFRRRAVPQFHYDPWMMPGDMVKDQVQLSEFADWTAVAGWAEALFAKALQQSAALEAVARQIEAQAERPQDRLRLALDFVQREIRYFGTEIGASSHQPESADKVLQQRFGDCKDKASLLVGLLRRLGLEARPALVSLQLREYVRQRLPSPLAFDHVIVAATLDGRTWWLDATRAHQRGALDERQSMGLGAALRAGTDVAELSRLPAAGEALRSETVDTFRFPRFAEEGRLESRVTYVGEVAEMLREARASLPSSEFNKTLLGDMLRLYAMLSVDGDPVVEEIEGRNALRVTLNFRIASYWRLVDKRSLQGEFGLGALMQALRLPDSTPRTQAMRLALPGRYLQSVRYEFGEEAFSTASSSRFDENNELFSLQLRFKTEIRRVQVDAELHIPQDAVGVGQWTRHRDQLSKIWPRLASTVTVPVLTPSQIPALREELLKLGERVRSGSIKLQTGEQVNARMRLAILDRELAADRLPPKLRSEALVERGGHHDHLGQLEAGRKDFENALALDAGNAGAQAALAVNALTRRQDQEAISHAERALALAPNEMGPRYTRAWARYFGGDTRQARDDLREILQSATEVERSYAAIWLYLSARRLGEDGVAALAELMPKASKPAWPYPVLQLMHDRLDLDAALAASRDGGQARRDRECELYFYAAQKALLDQDLAKARSYLQKSVATGVIEFNEYAMAQRELDRIGAR